MRDLVLAVIVFGLLPFVLKRAHWGVYLSAWLGYMNPHRLCYAFMFTTPVVMIVAVTTMLGMFFSKEKYRMIWTRETILLAVMLVWMGVTTSQAFFFNDAWDQYIKVIKIQILTLMTLLVLTSRERVHMLVWIIALSIGFFGVKGGIFTIMHGGVYRVMGPDGTFISGNNEIALAISMTVPLMRYLQMQEKRLLFKLGLNAAMFLSAVAAIGSQSRGALVAMVLMGAMLWLKSRNKFMIAILLAATVGVIASIMPQAWYDRMNTIQTYESDRSAMGRINAWWTAYNVARDRVTGGGFEMFRYPIFKRYAPDPNMVHDVHSIYFEMLGEHGFPGLGMFLLLLGFTWLKCGSIIRRCKNDPDRKWAADLAAMIQVSMVGYGSAGAFLGLAYFDYIYHLVAITVVLGSLTALSAAPRTQESKTKASVPNRSTPSRKSAHAHRVPGVS